MQILGRPHPLDLFCMQIARVWMEVKENLQLPPCAQPGTAVARLPEVMENPKTVDLMLSDKYPGLIQIVGGRESLRLLIYIHGSSLRFLMS